MECFLSGKMWLGGGGGEYISESKKCPNSYEDANSIRAQFLHI